MTNLSADMTGTSNTVNTLTRLSSADQGLVPTADKATPICEDPDLMCKQAYNLDKRRYVAPVPPTPDGAWTAACNAMKTASKARLAAGRVRHAAGSVHICAIGQAHCHEVAAQDLSEDEWGRLLERSDALVEETKQHWNDAITGEAKSRAFLECTIENAQLCTTAATAGSSVDNQSLRKAAELRAVVEKDVAAATATLAKLRKDVNAIITAGKAIHNRSEEVKGNRQAQVQGPSTPTQTTKRAARQSDSSLCGFGGGNNGDIESLISQSQELSNDTTTQQENKEVQGSGTSPQPVFTWITAWFQQGSAISKASCSNLRLRVKKCAPANSTVQHTGVTKND